VGDAVDVADDVYRRHGPDLVIGEVVRGVAQPEYAELPARVVRVHLGHAAVVQHRPLRRQRLSRWRTGHLLPAQRVGADDPGAGGGGLSFNHGRRSVAES
jgi:hypothetical protein